MLNIIYIPIAKIEKFKIQKLKNSKNEILKIQKMKKWYFKINKKRGQWLNQSPLTGVSKIILYFSYCLLIPDIYLYNINNQIHILLI